MDAAGPDSGVGAGEVILAVAVLSIVVTAPLGALGILILGERILDTEERSLYKFKDLRERMGLPRVGTRVCRKPAGPVWKVIEEKEEWLPAASASDAQRSVPAIALRLWLVDDVQTPGSGQTQWCRYDPQTPYFEKDWEILYDW